MAVLPRFEPVEVQFEALQVATKFVFGTLWQGGDVSKVLEWRLVLQALYHSDVGGCRWFLSTMEANESLLLELLVFNEHREVRELMANVLSEAIATTSNTEFEEEAEAVPQTLSEDHEANKQLPASFEFMFFVIQLMPALLSVPVQHHRQYFLTMYDFVQTGRNEGSFLVVNSVVEVEDHHDVKPYFRTLNSLLKMRDSLAEERLADGLTKLIAVMASQQKFYKATETSLDMLARLAKRHSAVTRWLRDNRMSCVWMEKWLLAHRGAEGYLQQRKTVLVKPNSTSSWVNVSVTSSGLIKAIDRSISKLLPRIRSILDPEAAVETFYDSDDNPQRLVGKRVRVKWAKDKWYEGTVQQFNEDTYEHFVAYDDGDKRSYHMSEKLFYVVDLTPSPKDRKKNCKA
ncbi:hypothetical protein BBI17_007969 [Phytophthora kernoviae]|uniref:Tudor domain-containing protein n=1 Tax=Phytophthora kernoviae TaxID=325452 RepID=A0A3R7J752_9STRA|nr:hypothetical protein JM16_007242 [Phytophthora kernoviae]RLN13962.1 hypothetical protein BBI17_007969 [Phytophthora kernoviae]